MHRNKSQRHTRESNTNHKKKKNIIPQFQKITTNLSQKITSLKIITIKANSNIFLVSI